MLISVLLIPRRDLSEKPILKRCANGAFSCVDGVNSYSCNCSVGYTGELFPN